MRAVLYCRVSTKDQLQNLSLPTQEKGCIDYCLRNGYEVDRIFVEEGESAKTADRTQLNKLLAYCRENKGRIHAVIVYAVSRFSRDRYSHVVLRAQLATLGITLRSVTEPIDDSSTGKLIEGVVSTVAQFDNDVRSERTVTGMKARLERGDWTFRPPLGYVKSLDAAGKKSNVPDPVRAPLIQKMFELYSTGLYSKEEVRAQITELGLVTKNGKSLSPETFNRILSNLFYAGELHVPAWGVRRPSNCPSLVGRETFDRVQALLRGNKVIATPHLSNNPDLPVKRFVRCGRCNRPLTASWSKGPTVDIHTTDAKTVAATLSTNAQRRCKNYLSISLAAYVPSRSIVPFLAKLLSMFGNINRQKRPRCMKQRNDGSLACADASRALLKHLSTTV
jgi:site-specific DNA recombinase